MRTLAGLILVMSLCIGCSSPFGSADGCPAGAIDQQRRGLAAVMVELPAEAVTTQLLNGCESGDAPFFTTYVTGKNDPVRALLKTNAAWSHVPREPSDPERRGTGAERRFGAATLSVTSRPYTEEYQIDQPEPGVHWYLAVWVR